MRSVFSPDVVLTIPGTDQLTFMCPKCGTLATYERATFRTMMMARKASTVCLVQCEKHCYATLGAVAGAATREASRKLGFGKSVGTPVPRSKTRL